MPDETENAEPEKPKPEEGKVFSSPNYTGQEMVIHAESSKWSDKPELETKDESPALVRDVVVVASNPQQMQVAQQNLIDNFSAKLGTLRAELKDAEENVRIAKERKWKRGPFETQVNKIADRIIFYEKVKGALEAGYVIIPNFEDLDIFAIRTTRKKPKGNVASGGSGWVQTPDRQVSNRPALGDGRYVNADTINKVWTAETTPAGAAQRTFRQMATAVGFDSIEFPFHLAKPQILESTAKAMKVLAFDDIGVSPGRKIRRGDPMIIGRIMHGTSHSRKIVSFLITWFVDTKDI